MGEKRQRDARGRFVGDQGKGGPSPDPSRKREGSIPSRAARLGVQRGRPGRPDVWSAEIRARFFAALAETCNIRAACRAVGMSWAGAYALRDRDASFRAGWRKALSQGYAKLELQMLERALIGEKRLRGAIRAKTDAEALDLLTRYPLRLAEILYRAHRQTALEHDGAADDDPDGEKARAEIDARLNRIRERLRREAAGD